MKLLFGGLRLQCQLCSVVKLCVNFPLLGVPSENAVWSINQWWCAQLSALVALNVIAFITIATTLLLLSCYACLNMLC